jgi:hypothetical protein
VIIPAPKIESVRERILQAFPKLGPPLRERLTEHRCDECDAVRDSFSRVEWWHARGSLIDSHFDNLSLFAAESFHYYLPSYLLRSLEAFDPENDVLQYSVYSLSPTHTPIDDPRYCEKLNLFTPEQISAVASFLKLIGADERFYNYYADSERGLRKFWPQRSQ